MTSTYSLHLVAFNQLKDLIHTRVLKELDDDKASLRVANVLRGVERVWKAYRCLYAQIDDKTAHGRYVSRRFTESVQRWSSNTRRSPYLKPSSIFNDDGIDDESVIDILNIYGIHDCATHAENDSDSSDSSDSSLSDDNESDDKNEAVRTIAVNLSKLAVKNGKKGKKGKK